MERRKAGKQEGWEEGLQQKSREAILDILETRFVTISPEIKNHLEQLKDPIILKNLLKIAVTVNSPEEFIKSIYQFEKGV